MKRIVLHRLEKITREEADDRKVGNMRILKDAVYGVAVGDAVGLPVQFKSRY